MSKFLVKAPLIPGLVNVYIANWKLIMLSMGKNSRTFDWVMASIANCWHNQRVTCRRIGGSSCVIPVSSGPVAASLGLPSHLATARCRPGAQDGTGARATWKESGKWWKMLLLLGNIWKYCIRNQSWIGQCWGIFTLYIYMSLLYLVSDMFLSGFAAGWQSDNGGGYQVASKLLQTLPSWVWCTVCSW